MSLLVPEIGWILDRVLVVAPDESSLRSLFEELALELAEKFGIAQRLDLVSASMPEGPVRCWTSFSAGQRADSTARFALIGVTTEDLATHPSLLEVADALFVSVTPPWSGNQRWLGLKPSLEGATKPVVVLGADLPMKGADPLEIEALREWFRRNFRQVRFLEEAQELLTSGLEWVLSF